MENKILIRLGKYLFGGSLVLTALLIILAVVPKWSDGINGLLDNLLHCNFYVKPYPVILLPLASVLFFLLIGLAAGLFSKSGKTEEDKPGKNKSFFFFYLCSFTLSSLLVFFLSTAFFNPFTEHFYISEKLALMAVIYLVTVVISLLQAALGLSAISLWKANIGVSILLLSILFLCLIVTVIPGAVISNLPDDNGSSSNYVEEVVVVEDSDSDGEYDYLRGDYDGYEYDDSPFCNGIWDDPDDCASNVESALNYARDSYAEYQFPEGYAWKGDLRPDIRENSWLWNDAGGYAGYRNFYKMANFLKNNPSHLARFFELYESTLYYTVSSRVYRKSAAPHIVSALNRAYDDLYRDGESDGRQKSLEIYSEMSKDDDSWAQSYFELISKYASKKSLDKFRDSEDLLDKDMVVWAYSFWARRENEGCAQTTYTILQKVAEHYQ